MLVRLLEIILSVSFCCCAVWPHAVPAPSTQLLTTRLSAIQTATTALKQENLEILDEVSLAGKMIRTFPVYEPSAETMSLYLIFHNFRISEKRKFFKFQKNVGYSDISKNGYRDIFSGNSSFNGI